MAGVVLAAGGSARFGSPKQLLSHHGENLVHRAARIALESGLDPVIVVLGAFSDSVAMYLSGLEDVEIVVNEDWQQGQSTSLRAGISRARSNDADAAVVILADQPLVNADSISRILVEFDDSHRVVASTYDGILGVPALFAAEHFDDLMSLKGDHGAGRWLRSRSDEVTAVEMPEAAIDIDSPEDMQHLRFD